MFRNMSNERHLTGGRSASSSVLDSQESSWIGLLSRPALALLQKIRNRTLKTSFVNEESDFLSQLDDVQLGPPHVSYLQCEHDAAKGLQEPLGAGTLSWLASDSLREMGLQSGTEVDLSICQHTQFGYFSSFRTVLGHILLSSQEVRAAGGQSWVPSASRKWWSSFWGGKEGSQRGQLSDVRWADEGTLAGRLCPHQTPRGMLGENAGPADHKEDLPNNGGLHIVQNTEEATSDHRLSISDQLSVSGAGEASPVTPEQDNGYASLEEEHLSALISPKEELPPQEAETSGRVEMEGDMSEGEEEEEAARTILQCRNKTINFIMGGPCSEDEGSQSEESTSDDDDDDDDYDHDDGFDSEGSSELSDTDEGDEDDSDSELDLEAARLWSSLCQNEDPYSPRNFTAHLHNIPTSTPPSSAHSTPSSSPPSSSDTWDDSASASEVDEESLRLWDSFTSSSDPFNPLNFQAPIRTHKVRVRKTSPCHNPASPPEYRKEEAEERLDSGFCEAATARRCSSTKKVRFCDDVKEFFASCGEEDRRGPWEELARDRCRFLRRCQEVEQSIAYCLQPQHRRRVYERLAVL